MHIKNGLFHVYGHSNNSPLTYMIRGRQSGNKSWCEGEKRWQVPRDCILDLKNLQGLWHAADHLIFQNRYIFSISLSSVEAHGSPLSTNLAPKKKSLHKTLPLIDLIHFPILPWEPNVFLLQSTNFPVSSLTCVIWLQVRAGCHSSRISSPELSFSQNSPALLSYKIIQNNVLLTSKDVLNFPVRFKFTEDGFNNPFWLTALKEGNNTWWNGIELL